MTTLKTFIGEKEIEIYNVSTMPASSGHQKITVEVSFDGDFKEFSATTSNMPGFDAAMNLEDNEKKHSLYELIESKIINDISDWLELFEC